MTQIITPKDLLGKDPTEMTIAELMRSMANICLPESTLAASERASMYISLMLKSRRLATKEVSK